MLCEYDIGEKEFCDQCARSANITYNVVDTSNDTGVFAPCGGGNLVIGESCIVTIDGEREVQYNVVVNGSGMAMVVMTACT